ncbi:DUF3558 family protein [Gordonia sp. (in: high G+C Gram-positive bacteria)]|uniref:DUF3558 family protein n=1 Tax=Gordonia sp. (in: high G+C Gram-positive bacteria) TaxID=84139 RepID=UPI003BB56E84
MRQPTKRPQVGSSTRVQRRCVVTLLALSLVVVLVGCRRAPDQSGSVQGADKRGSASTSSSAVDLPFDTTFTQRWNPRNDGTAYEPCVTPDEATLLALGIDHSSISDAAGTDGQTLRGCSWDYFSDRGQDHWSLTQMVANSGSLADYRRKYAKDHWMPDRTIRGRAAGVTDSPHLGECMTYVQSARAGITTLAIHHGLPHPPVREVCDRAIAFTEATIGKMPR